MAAKKIPRPNGKNTKDMPKRHCKICGKEIKNGGRFCNFCSSLYSKKKYHSRVWKDKPDDVIIAEISRIRKAEKEKLTTFKEKYNQRILCQT